MVDKIGICVSTCDRLDYLKKCVDSLSGVDAVLCVCNDGAESVDDVVPSNAKVLKTDKPRSGISINKNLGLKYLLEQDCDYFFLIEDDCFVKDTSVFERYIDASKKTGIQHFNYGPGTPFNRKQNVEFDLHNRDSLDQSAEPNPRTIIDYGDIKIPLYTHIAGMFSFFTRKTLEEVGLMDEDYYNAWEHVDHTYRIIKNKMHPPFWYFADIENSEKYLSEHNDAINNSVISKNNKEWLDGVNKGREIYLQKHGHYPNQPPQISFKEVTEDLKFIKVNN